MYIVQLQSSIEFSLNIWNVMLIFSEIEIPLFEMYKIRSAGSANRQENYYCSQLNK